MAVVEHTSRVSFRSLMNKSKSDIVRDFLSWLEAAAWRPIKTVPDGEPVLLYSEEWAETVGDTQIGIACREKGSFMVEACAGADFNPTHWMPLPEPPLSIR